MARVNKTILEIYKGQDGMFFHKIYKDRLTIAEIWELVRLMEKLKYKLLEYAVKGDDSKEDI